MAIKKIDTRQKMINMMYLVFIAMLALNISKEVLGTLGILNDDLESSIYELESSSKVSYDQIASNSENLDYKIAAIKVSEMKIVSDEFYDFIKTIKDYLINSDKDKFQKEVKVPSKGDSIINMTDYQIMDNSKVLDNYFFNKNGNTENGNLFIEKFKNYPIEINLILDSILTKEKESLKETKINYDFSSTKLDLNNRFKYSEKVVNTEGTLQPYLEYNYKEFPMIASISKLTKIQTDIRYVENKVLTQILDAVQNKGLSFSTFQTLLETTKSAYYTSDVIDAAIVMGKKDESFRPDTAELFLNKEGGSRILLNPDEEYTFETGKVVLNKRLSSPGTYELSGTITKKNADTQESISIPVNQKILVIREPNSAVVSADNMRVFYRTLRNPVSISIPGVADNTVIPSSKNGTFFKSSSGWLVRPSETVDSLLVSVSGILNDKRRNFSGGKFRIEPKPPGEGSVVMGSNSFKIGDNISVRNLTYGIITGTKPKNFKYEYEIIVRSFDIKIGYNSTLKVNGNTPAVNPGVVSGIKNAKGETVVISNIVSSTKDGALVTPDEPGAINPFFLVLK